MTNVYKYSWEEAIDVMRADPVHAILIRDSYLSDDLVANCHRFHTSDEFAEVLTIVRKHAPAGHRVLDLAAGNGIASYAFAREGFCVTSLEPDPSDSVGRGAIETVVSMTGITGIKIVEGFGEALSFPDKTFDVVYVRQALHHARNLERLLCEAARVLRPDGILLATREPVVDSPEGLQKFLDDQPDHQLYGGEHAFTLTEYLRSFRRAGLKLVQTMGQFDSIINLYPQSFTETRRMLIGSRSGRFLKRILPEELVYRLALTVLKRTFREQGRLYSFIAKHRSLSG